MLDAANFRTVRSFVREPVELASYKQSLLADVQSYARQTSITGFVEPLRYLIGQGSELCGLYIGGNLVLQGKLEAGELVNFVRTADNQASQLRYLMDTVNQLQEILEPVGKLYDLLMRKPKIGLYGGLRPESPPAGLIRFENVKFSYPTRPGAKILRGMTFTVEPGTVCALIGPSGAGKSTVIALLERFYDPLEGRITLDGVNIRDLERAGSGHSLPSSARSQCSLTRA